MRFSDLTGKQKAAILLITLGPDVSARVFRHLREDKIEDLTLEIAALPRVEPEYKDAILGEFHELCLASEYMSQGGIEYAKEVLEKALGAERPMKLLPGDNITARPLICKADPTTSTKNGTPDHAQSWLICSPNRQA